jgi:hypothetical protein
MPTKDDFYRAIQERRREIDAAKAVMVARPPQPPRLHEILVRKVCERPGVERYRFPAALRRLLEQQGDFDAEEMDGHRTVRRPDAFAIDFEGKTVTLFEVEVRHPVDDKKRRAYRYVALALYDIGWTLIMVRVTRHGEDRENLSQQMYDRLGWKVTQPRLSP